VNSGEQEKLVQGNFGFLLPIDVTEGLIYQLLWKETYVNTFFKCIVLRNVLRLEMGS